MLKRKTRIFIFWIYLFMLFSITVFRKEFGTPELLFKGKIYFIPFINLINILKNQGMWAFIYQFVGNIIWFMPVGYILPQISRKEYKIGHIALAGFLISVLIETLQFIFGVGVSEIDDLILNTLGTILGCLILKNQKRR